MEEREAWVCVDGHGNELLFASEPYKVFPNMSLDVLWGRGWCNDSIEKGYRRGILLPKGTIKYLIGRELDYSDNPVKLTY